MYDPYQTHSALGVNGGLGFPLFQSPYSQINPLLSLNPLALANPSIAGMIPQLHLAQILARTAVPQWLGANPLLASAVLQNPLIAATLENALLNPLLTQTQFGGHPHLFGGQSYPFGPQLGHIGSQFGQSYPQIGQIGSLYGQTIPQLGQLGSPFGQLGSMLPPQSWIGQQGWYGLGQAHPLTSQFSGRGFQGGGF